MLFFCIADSPVSAAMASPGNNAAACSGYKGVGGQRYLWVLWFFEVECLI